jgi:hypothetical protein
MGYGFRTSIHGVYKPITRGHHPEWACQMQGKTKNKPMVNHHSGFDNEPHMAFSLQSQQNHPKK